MNAPITPAFADLIDEGIANSVLARKHLEWMKAHEPQMYAELQAQWAAAEHRREPISAEIKARAAAEWENDQ